MSKRLPAAKTAILIALLSWPSVSMAEVSDTTSAKADFAERISELGQNWLHAGTLSPEAFLQTAAVLRAAMREDPRQPRYPRLLGNAMEQLHDLEGQIDAWTAYRRLVPDDRTAQLKLIELYSSKMQTNDAKVEYLKDLLAKPSLPDEVRAEIASMCATVLLERSADEAVQVVEQGLKIYPLPDLLSEKYFLVWKNGTPVQRVHGLLALLRSNPVQPQVMQALAHELASEGLSDLAVEWYANALALNNQLGVPSQPDFFTEYVAELYLSRQTQAAQQLLANLLDSDRENAVYLFLNLSLQRSDNDALAFNQTLGLTRDTLLRRWSRLNIYILSQNGGQAPPPPDNAVPITPADPTPAVDKVKQLQNDRLTEAFVSTMVDLAWFELYYANQPKAATPWIDALRQTLPADHPLLARLQGWYHLQSGEADKADQQLSLVADHDVLAKLALIKLHGSTKAITRDDLRQLLLAQPVGLDAAVIEENLRELDAPPTGDSATTAPSATAPSNPAPLTTAPASAPPATATSTTAPTVAASQPTRDPAITDAIRVELKQFPKPWLMLINQPLRFYSLKVEPLQTTVRFGQAMYARVTITSHSDYDLVIGFHGPIQPHLWFDVNVSGIIQQNFLAAAYDQITNTFVLRAHGATSQIVRIDQGVLGEAVRQHANGSMVVAGTILTNPSRFGNGIGPAAAGQMVPFTRGFIRTPTDMQSNAAQQQIRETLKSGPPSEKMADLDLLSAYVSGLDHQTLPSVRELADAYLLDIAVAAGDPNPEVAAWASYLSATLPKKTSRRQMIDQMLASHDWQSRLLGLAALHAQPPALQQTSAARLASDSDSDVKTLALAIAQAAEHPDPAATQPASQTQPSTPPAQP